MGSIYFETPCTETVYCSFISTGTIRTAVGTGRPLWPPPLSHSSWALQAALYTSLIINVAISSNLTLPNSSVQVSHCSKPLWVTHCVSTTAGKTWPYHQILHYWTAQHIMINHSKVLKTGPPTEILYIWVAQYLSIIASHNLYGALQSSTS